MADQRPPSKFRKDYEDAEQLFDNGYMDGCEKAVRHNLQDLALPRYYVIKNCILLTSVLDDWDDAEIWRLAAEQAHYTAVRYATDRRDTLFLQVLQDLREELDQLIEFKWRDTEQSICCWHEESDEEMDIIKEEEEEDEEEELGKDAREDNNTPAPAMIHLPIRLTKPPEITAIPVDATPPGPPAIIEPPAAPATNDKPARRLRKKKSAKFGGAYNAHAFTKSLSKGQSSARGSLLDMDWHKGKEEEAMEHVDMWDSMP